MCSTSRTSISPIGKINNITELMLHYNIYCHLTIPTKAVCNNQVLSSYSSLSHSAGIPRFRVCTGLYSVQMWSAVKGAIFSYWSIITGGMNWGSYNH